MVNDRTSFTHAICMVCWDQCEPTREPHRLKEPDIETCCFCGIVTRSGVYVRGDPKAIHPPEARV